MNEFDKDWDGKNDDMEWTEFHWQEYLKRNEQDILRFLNLYMKMRHQADHLDAIARLMQWEDDDWYSADESEPDMSLDKDEEEADELESLEPYTIHKHPVYIVTNGLYRHLRSCWEQYAMSYPQKITPVRATQFTSSLHAGESNALMAINSLDVGDFRLAVCHLKNALSALNHTMGMLQRLPVHSLPASAMFQYEAQAVLFDLREVWLRVMRECREEARNPRDGGDGQ